MWWLAIVKLCDNDIYYLYFRGHCEYHLPWRSVLYSSGSWQSHRFRCQQNRRFGSRRYAMFFSNSKISCIEKNRLHGFRIMDSPNVTPTSLLEQLIHFGPWRCVLLLIRYNFRCLYIHNSKEKKYIVMKCEYILIWHQSWHM